MKEFMVVWRDDDKSSQSSESVSPATDRIFMFTAESLQDRTVVK